MTVNGSVPGPTIYADWGDWVVVHVKNSVPNNGTSMHWHGLRQLMTSQEDGVASITQCPTAPGDTITYKWHATQYGHTWYHSHYALQAWNGVFGGIIINGPASAPYDEDRGVLFLNDWTHQTTDQLWPSAQLTGPPRAQNGLINGTNIYTDPSTNITTGERYSTTFTSGKRHRLRLVNGAIDSMFKFSIDGHQMTVIATDLVPIEPFQTNVLSIGIGQRYDIIVEAVDGQTSDSYWMRASPDSACSAANDMSSDIKGIVRYAASDELPTSSAYTWEEDCLDESTDSLVPYLKLDASLPSFQTLNDVSLSASSGVFKWTINDTSFQSEWNEPTLEQVIDDVTVFNATEHIISVDIENEWVYLIVESALALTHPIHLHGHDFYILAQGTGTYDSSVNLTTTNPTRRDTAMLPAAGHLVLGYITDNPGVWLMHCHIGWHQSEGFALQFIERYSEIEATVDIAKAKDQCSAWDAYVATSHIEQEDSGI